MQIVVHRVNVSNRDLIIFTNPFREIPFAEVPCKWIARSYAMCSFLTGEYLRRANTDCLMYTKKKKIQREGDSDYRIQDSMLSETVQVFSTCTLLSSGGALAQFVRDEDK